MTDFAPKIKMPRPVKSERPVIAEPVVEVSTVINKSNNENLFNILGWSYLYFLENEITNPK